MGFVPSRQGRLADGVRDLTTSRGWQGYLGAARRLHNNSFANTLLIQGQMSTATRVAGFHAWRSMGRNVRRGEHASWILAPVTRRRDEDAAADADKEPKSRVAIAFRVVPVFDMSQTDEPLPEVATRLNGDDPDNAFDPL